MKLPKGSLLSHAAFPLLLIATLSLLGCATPRQGPALPEVSIAFTSFSQPQSIGEMLAGYMPEDTPRVPAKALAELDEAFAEVLNENTNRSFASAKSYYECKKALPQPMQRGRVGALNHWVAVGQCMGVDFLLVPQVLQLQEREGGEAGVTQPAEVVMDIFLIDVKNANLTSRSHFNERQTALANNLLETRKFFSRGARWITATQLAREGMVQAIKDLGL